MVEYADKPKDTHHIQNMVKALMVEHALFCMEAGRAAGVDIAHRDFWAVILTGCTMGLMAVAGGEIDIEDVRAVLEKNNG